MTIVPMAHLWKDVSWCRFKYFQILDKLTLNHFRASLGYSENQTCPYNRSVNLSVPLFNTHTYTHSACPTTHT